MLTAEEAATLELRVASLDQTDYFELLGLSQTATVPDIKRAFYKESRAYHPDRFFHVEDAALKARINDLYKRVTEAYYVLRDDQKRRRYLADINGPERDQKLRFTELSEAESKQQKKREAEEQVGVHPKARQLYQAGVSDLEGKRWAAAERNFKMALTFEPSNPRYREGLERAQRELAANTKKEDPFKIR